MELLNRFRRVIFFEEDGSSGSKFKRNMIILLLIGVFLLLAGPLFSSQKVEEPVDVIEDLRKDSSSVLDYQRMYFDINLSQDVSAVLNHIEGISDAVVLITLESGPEQVLAENIDISQRRTGEDDGGGGSRETVEESRYGNYVLIRDRQGGEVPIVLYEKNENYRGALVVARGVRNTHNRAMVTEAVSALLGLPLHRITVLPRG